MSPGDTIGPGRDLRRRGSGKPRLKAAPLLGAWTSVFTSVKQRAWTQGLGGWLRAPRLGVATSRHAASIPPSPNFANGLAWEAGRAFLVGGSFFNITASQELPIQSRYREKWNERALCAPEIVPGKTLWLIPARGRGARENPAEGRAAAWRCVPNLPGRRNPLGPDAQQSLVPPPPGFGSPQGLLHPPASAAPREQGRGSGERV